MVLLNTIKDNVLYFFIEKNPMKRQNQKCVSTQSALSDFPILSVILSSKPIGSY